MHKHLKNLIIFSALCFNTSFAIAQIQTFDHLKVDSLTFAETKAVINKIPNDKFEKRIYKHNNTELPYRLLFPKNYDIKKKYPVVITFHNSTRIGNDNEKQLEPLSKIWLRTEIYENYNCFVIAPQFNERSSNYLANENGLLLSKPGDKINLVLDLLNEMEAKYTNIDQSKIYLVGYSMGASTAQNLLSLAPQKFAAVVSIAAVPDFSNLKAMKRKSILLIHGQKDVENPYKGSAELFEQLKQSKKITFKTFTELNHDTINIPLLLSAEIPEWLFKQHK